MFRIALPLIHLKARRGFGGERTPSSHTSQATLHNTAHHTSGGDDDPAVLAHLPRSPHHHKHHQAPRISSHTRSSMGECSSSRTIKPVTPKPATMRE